ncbi:hypothetical protein ACFVHB_13575 [Kitasatospora sp. NPDC127111]|uniref:hypothetical protein n=1 Tax=Kitasatospora sp. NPDC127111 TaxID=3345363 RepID=UPI00363F4CA3
MLFASATVVAPVVGLVRVTPWGSVERVVVTAWQTRHAGRSNHVRGEARSAAGVVVSLRQHGHPGENVDAVRAPWGSHVVPQQGPAAWASALPAPPLPLLAAAGCAVATRRTVRRLRGTA